MPQPDRTRELTIVAQDPLLTYPKGHPKEGRIVTARIRVPAERLADGPRGYRVHCIDYDATTNTYYDTKLPKGRDRRRFDDPSDEIILGDPSFHCQNAYALVMHTLARFEFALGRRVSWGFYGHQLKVAPHAFAEANAFYSEEDHALLFGYFYPEGQDRPVFTCLSHDVIVHETTHALLDGLRTRYTDPSSPDQAAFHEGFSDVIALLSVFSLREVPELLITHPKLETSKFEGLIPTSALTPDKLRHGIGRLAEEVGKGLLGIRANALRESLNLDPKKTNINDPEFVEPHRRGEVFVAAMMNAFIRLWSREIDRIGARWSKQVDRSKVVEEGARLADVMLTSAIRALDYAPPVDLTFSDYLSAFLTADQEIRSEDRLDLRKIVRDSFEDYGIEPITPGGTWTHAPDALTYDRTHFEPMQSDPDEVFHWVWENREQEYLGLLDDGYTRILSVRPCVRVGPDGFILRETVSEYIQVLKIRAGDLATLKLKKPKTMPDEQEIYLYGGGALIFDEYGRLKYHVYNPLQGKKQSARIAYLWEHGYYRADRSQLAFAGMHRMRAIGGFAFGEASQVQEVW